MNTDKKRLDWLQEQLSKCTYTGRCVFRWSYTGRGFRLHETRLPEAVESVREAIDNAMQQYREDN